MNKTLSDCSSSLPSKPYFSAKIGIGHQERAGAVLEKSCDIRVKMNEEQTAKFVKHEYAINAQHERKRKGIEIRQQIHQTVKN